MDVLTIQFLCHSLREDERGTNTSSKSWCLYFKLMKKSVFYFLLSYVNLLGKDILLFFLLTFYGTCQHLS